MIPPKAAPHTILLKGHRDEDGVVAIHFKDPSWQATDGSMVVGGEQWVELTSQNTFRLYLIRREIAYPVFSCSPLLLLLI
jgi:hypothetical protein